MGERLDHLGGVESFRAHSDVRVCELGRTRTIYISIREFTSRSANDVHHLCMFRLFDLLPAVTRFHHPPPTVASTHHQHQANFPRLRNSFSPRIEEKIRRGIRKYYRDGAHGPMVHEPRPGFRLISDIREAD